MNEIEEHLGIALEPTPLAAPVSPGKPVDLADAMPAPMVERLRLIGASGPLAEHKLTMNVVRQRCKRTMHRPNVTNQDIAVETQKWHDLPVAPCRPGRPAVGFSFQEAEVRKRVVAVPTLVVLEQRHRCHERGQTVATKRELLEVR